jgi:hypothetical protein
MSEVSTKLILPGSEYSVRIVDESLREFTQLQTWRNVFAAHWEEVAELVLPTSRNTFYYGSYNFPGQKKTERQVDASAAMALSRFVAILDSLLTPRNMTWHTLTSTNPQVNKDRRARLWFEAANRILFQYRYSPNANFSSQNCNHWQGLGAFGTGNLLIDRYSGLDGSSGLRYRELPLGEMYLRENHQGQVDGFCRHFRLTAEQAIRMFTPKDGEPLDYVGERIVKAAQMASQAPFDFLHRVCPRDDYVPGRIGPKGMIYGSYHISMIDRRLVREGGYTSFPVSSSRYEQTPGEVYGRSPAMMVLPAIKTLNAEKKDFLTQGHRAGTPVLLTTDDGVVDFAMRPGALNKGGMSEEGRPLVGVLPSGNIQVTKEMMDEERALIEGAFLTDLFKVLLGDPKIFTATQIVEMMSQRGILIAPTVGRQQSEYLGPMIDRELDVLSSLHLLPPMPGILQEAKGEYHVAYASPLARDMRSQEIAGFQRTLETAMTVANATQDASIFDSFDFDTALPAISEIQSVPESWMAAPEVIQAKRQRRAQQQQAQQQVNSMPAQAAMLKARAAMAKSGMTPEQNVQQPQGQQ